MNWSVLLDPYLNVIPPSSVPPLNFKYRSSWLWVSTGNTEGTPERSFQSITTLELSKRESHDEVFKLTTENKVSWNLVLSF